jgi:ATP-dependent DNA helicase RecG
MEEAIVNAVYHRGYDGPPEPVKIYLYPDRMEIISYPGPVPGIEKNHFEVGQFIPPVPARNRRIGEFLKELRLAEGRGTGIPKIQRKMVENGSPDAIFDFDDPRSYFRVILPVHPRYRIIHSIREAVHFWVTGDKKKAIDHLDRAYSDQPSSGALASQIIEYAFDLDDSKKAEQILKTFESQTRKTEEAQPYLTMARKLIDKKMEKDALAILKRVPLSRTLRDIVDTAILQKRARDYESAHRFFSQAYDMNPDDQRIVHEFAQTKLFLAKRFWHAKDITVKKRLNREAAELLRKAIQLSDDPIRQSWCWFDLAKTLDWLRVPKSEVEQAYLNACSLSDEPKIHEHYQRWRDKVIKGS